LNEAQAIGQRLREAREARELSLDDVERAIRIRARFVEALEQGDYSPMTPVQAQGFLRNYARFLGLDLDLLLDEIGPMQERGRRWRLSRTETPLPPAADETPTPLPPPRAARPIVPPTQPESQPAPKRAPRRRTQRGVLGNLAIVLLAGAIVIGLVLGLTQLLDTLVSTPEPEAPVQGEVETPPVPTIAEEAAGTAEGGGEPLPADGTTPEAPAAFTPPVLTGPGVTISIQLTQRSWLSVTVDGEIAREGLGRPGEVWQFSGTESVGIRASNAAALNLTVNNQPQGTLGARGQMFEYVFALEGVVVPTEAGPETPTPEGVASGLSEPDLTSPLPPDATVSTESLPASPEQATLIITDTVPPVTPTALPTLSDGVPESLSAPTATPEPPITTQEAEPTATPEDLGLPPALPTSTPAPTHTPPPAATEPPTATPEPPTATNTPSPEPSATRTPAPSATHTPTRTSTPTPSTTPTRTPTPTLTPFPTFTPSSTPFLPPRITRTPSPPPKPQ